MRDRTCERCPKNFFGDGRFCKSCRAAPPDVWECRMCGSRYAADEHMEGDVKWPLCFECDHFCELLARPDGIIVDGTHYVIGPEGAGRFRGHGGGLFIIEMLDQSVVRSTNVWRQGTFPGRFKPFIKDNAKFRR